MPTDALPQARALIGPVAGARTLRRSYRDALGRPMQGKVRVTGKNRAEVGRTVVSTAPVFVDLVNGDLEASLLPGEYSLRAELVTVDGDASTDVSTVQH